MENEILPVCCRFFRRCWVSCPGPARSVVITGTVVVGARPPPLPELSARALLFPSPSYYYKLALPVVVFWRGNHTATRAGTITGPYGASFQFVLPPFGLRIGTLPRVTGALSRSRSLLLLWRRLLPVPWIERL